jgi:aspartate 1-decarboxylase
MPAMYRTMLTAKLHRVRATETNLDYEGSVAIDRALLEAADIREYEQIHIYNVANGERFSSYAVSATPHSGTVAVLGAAARKVSRGDILIICTYAELGEAEVAQHKPRLVYVDAGNRITHTRNAVQPLPASRTA